MSKQKAGQAVVAEQNDSKEQASPVKRTSASTATQQPPNGDSHAVQINPNKMELATSIAALEECVDLIPKPLDGGYGWVVCIAAMTLNCILDGIGYAFSVFIPAFQEAFSGASKSDVAWIGAMLGGMYMLSGPISSALVNKFGCQSVTMAGALLATIAFLAASQSHSLIVMIITFGVMGGFGFGLIYLPSIVSVGHYFEKKRALATGLAVCGSGIGMFVFAPLSEFLLEKFDLRNAIVCLAAIVLQGAWLGALLVSLDKKQPRTAYDTTKRRQQHESKRTKQSSNGHEETPRAKNTLDRVYERVANWLPERRPSQHSGSFSSASDAGTPAHADSNERKLAAVREAKEARQARLDVTDGANVPTARAVVRRHDSITNADGAVIGGFAHQQTTDKDKDKDNCGDAVEGVNREHNDSPQMVRRSGTGDATGPPRTRLCTSTSHTTSLLRVPSGTEKGASSHLSAARARYESLRTDGLSSSSTATLHKDASRPLYRQDIFYSGSVANIDKYQMIEQAREHDPQIVPPHAYTASVTCIPVATEAATSVSANHPNSTNKTTSSDHKQRSGGCLSCLPKPSADVLAEMLNLDLLKTPAFALILVGNLFAMFGFIVPFIYVVDMARGFATDGNDSSLPPSLLLTFAGVTNTIGRVLCGWISSQPQVDGLLLHNITLVIAGILTLFVPVLGSYALLAAYALAYGFFISPFICLSSVILCDVVGVEALTNSFGLLCLVRGIVTIASSPFAGFLYDLTGSYNWSFLMSGGTILVGAACHFLLHIPALQTDQMRHHIATRRALSAAKQRNAVVQYAARSSDASSSSSAAIEVYHEDDNCDDVRVGVRVGDRERKIRDTTGADQLNEMDKLLRPRGKQSDKKLESVNMG